MKSRKRSGRRWWSIAIILVGFLICSYPIVSGLYQRSVQSGSLKTYSKALRRNEDQVEGLLKAADTYNDMLFQTQGNYIQGISDKYLTEKAYEKQLRLKDSDVMARIEIPKISVDLPIYHGVSESVLSKGVGHLRSGSLPVGGESTHAALSGHRGLPSSKLFTRLDELEKGDLFYIDVLGRTLAYRICDIQTTDPEDTDLLEIQEGRDLVTLITCTPYGINTKRLLVTGERAAYEKQEKESIQGSMMSIRELIFTAAPFVIITLLLGKEIYHHRKRRSKGNEEAK